ncbi:MAG: tRNA (guanosine(46)-N7)-methyltransferase TrmB [Candidatus Delongbacteria bacterium]
MWLSVDEYYNKINSDSRKYFELNDRILEINSDILPLDFGELFENPNKKIKFEIGFGNGDSLIKLALKNPDINYFGIDRKMDRIRIALKKLNKIDKVKNLIIARSGTEYLDKIIDPGAFDEIIMNFPDPWPKKRHHKNRTLNSEFIRVLHDLLKKGSMFRFASDHEEYSLEILDIFLKSALFENAYPEDYKNEVRDRIETQFERHKKKDGCKIYYMKFRKI